MKKIRFIVFLVFIIFLLSGCQNFNDTYSISGIITTEDGEPAPKVTIMYEGANSGSTYTNAEGEYNISGLTGETDIIPKKTNCNFSPKKRTVESSNLGVDFIAEGEVATINPEVHPLMEIKNVNIEETSEKTSFHCDIKNIGSIGHFYLRVYTPEEDKAGRKVQEIYSNSKLPRNSTKENVGFTEHWETNYIEYEFIVHVMINDEWVVTDKVIHESN